MKKIPDFTSPVFKKSSDLSVRISQIPPMDVAFQTMALSEYELLVATIHKLNELVTMTNSYSELIDEILKWVVGDGLDAAVKNLLTEWKNDGTLEILINDVLFESKLDKTEFNTFVSDVYNVFEERIDKDVKDLNAKTKDKWMSVKEFGAKGDGLTDDTSAIQECVDHVATHGGVVYIPKGVYLIQAEDKSNTLTHLWDTGGIILKDNVHIVLDKKATLKAKPSTQGAYHIFTIYRKSNITIEGGTLKGERYEHLGPDDVGEFGFGIAINGDSSNIIIKDMFFQDFWGDGLHINNRTTNSEDYPKNVTIDNVISNGNRRQGMSILAGKNILVQNSTFKNSRGILPEMGLDIEPWTNETTCEDITLKKCVFTGNHKEGLAITSAGYGAVIKNVLVEDCVIKGNNKSNTDTTGQVILFDYNKQVSFNNTIIKDVGSGLAIFINHSDLNMTNSYVEGSMSIRGGGNINFTNTEMVKANTLTSYVGDVKALTFRNCLLKDFELINIESAGEYLFIGGEITGVKQFSVNKPLVIRNSYLNNLGFGSVSTFNLLSNASMELTNSTIDKVNQTKWASLIFKENQNNLIVLDNLIYANNNLEDQLISVASPNNVKNFILRNIILPKTNSNLVMSSAVLTEDNKVDYESIVLSDYGQEGDVVYDRSSGKIKKCTTSYVTGEVPTKAVWEDAV